MKQAPLWARIFLAASVPLSRREDVLGDLNEVHDSRRARLRPWAAWLASSWDALRVAAAFAICRCGEWRDQMKQWIVWPEVKLGMRLVRKQPLMATAVILALAAGIAIASIGFTLREGVLTSELPFQNGDRFVMLTVFQEPGGRRARLDLDRYHLLREEATTLEHLGALRGAQPNILHPSGEVEPVQGAFVTPSSFRFLPFAPLLGRTLVAEDGQPGAAAVALIRQSLWERRYERDPQVIGSSLNVSGVDRTIVGVMPDEFEFPTSGEIWIPLEEHYLGGSGPSDAPPVRVFGLLKPDVPLATAQQQMSALSARAAEQRHEEAEVRLKLDYFPQAFVTGRFDLVVTVLVSVLVLVLLVIASNVANLILARSSSRSCELAIRTALGAERSRLVGQIFVEVAILGAIAAVIGLAAAYAVLERVGGSVDEIPFWISLTPNAKTLAFVTVITLLASAVGGILPALKATRRDPAVTLQSNRPAGGPIGLGRMGAVMIVVEMALSVALLSGAAVMARALAGHLNQDFGLPANRVLTAQVYVSPPQDGDGSLAALKLSVVEAARKIPGVAWAGAASHLPRQDPRSQPVVVEPLDGQLEQAAMQAPIAAVGPGFFEALGVAAGSGRLLSEADLAEGAAPVAIVNQPFVEKFLAGRNPIGRRLRATQTGPLEESTQWREIIGVVPDLGLSAADEASAAGYYIPWSLRQNSYFHLALYAQGDPSALSMPLRQAILEVDPTARLTRVMPLEQVGEEERMFFSVMGSSLIAIGAMALLLSLMGIYAIMSFSVQARTREIGIRMALGAAYRQILWPVVGRSSLYLVLGAVLGTALGAVLMQAKGIFVSRLPTGEPWVFPVVIMLMATAGLLACWTPARRALTIRPAEALRQ